MLVNRGTEREEAKIHSRLQPHVFFSQDCKLFLAASSAKQRLICDN